jgi:hypothetical protein
MTTRRRIVSVRLAVLAALTLGICLAGASEADAAGYRFVGAFGASAEPSFGEATALAVDPADGDLLVVDVHEVGPGHLSGAIKRYASDGTPANFSALGSNVIDGEGSGPPCVPPSSECDGTPQGELDFWFANPREVQVAVAPPGAAGGTEGDIYVNQPRQKLIDVFAPSGEYVGQLTASNEGPFGEANGVAVDPAGVVYVPEKAAIHKFLPSSNSPFAASNVANLPQNLSTESGSLAAGAESTADSIFAKEFNGNVSKLDSTSGIEQCQVDPGESITLVVSPETGHLFSASATEVKEYEGSCTASPEVAVRSFAPGAGIRGIAVGAAGTIYVSRKGLSTVEVWEVVKVPETRTLPAGPVELGDATLRGEVNPNGLPLTECAFEWGETTAYGHVAPCEGPDAAEVGEGTLFVPVHAAVAGLEAGTAYHFRLVAANANNNAGEVIPGGDQDLRTLGPQVRGAAASEVTATTARIGATIDPDGQETGFWVEYLSDAAFQANPETERFIGAARAPLGEERKVPVAVSGSGNVENGSSIVTGVLPTSGAFGPGETITGPGIPVGTTILSLPTPTQLQLSTAATLTTAAADLTATGPQPVSQLLTGLEPGTTYHFRVVAKNGAATVPGAAGVLTTFALSGGQGSCPNGALRTGFSAGLPDCRAYEMISPSHKGGEVIAGEPEGALSGSCRECLPAINNPTLPMQSAPDGDAVLFSGQPFTGGLSARPNEYLSSRTAGGWDWQSLSPPATSFGIWEAFSSDLTRGILAQTEPPLAPAAPTRGGLAFANLYLQVAGGRFEPLITTEPPNRTPRQVGPNQFRVRFAAANSGTTPAQAFTHIALEANDELTEAVKGVAPTAPAVAESTSPCSVAPCDIYEWSNGRLGLVNVLPGNAQATGEAVIGSGYLLISGDPAINVPDVDHAVSADGSRIFWTDTATGQTYVRVDGNKTLAVPGPSTCKKSVALESRACFLTASADGGRVLLSNGQIDRLEKAGTGEEEYVPEIDLTAGTGGFQGILGAATDLSRVYFVDTEALTPPRDVNANPTGPEHAEEGAFNLYIWQKGGTTKFIGRLASGDNEGGFGSWRASPSARTAQVTPDGRYLAFMSRARLTGYDNSGAGGQSCRPFGAEPVCYEVFEYAADAGHLACASCNPSGQRPVGRSNLSLLRNNNAGAAFRQPGNLSAEGNGRLFFESQDALVPQDTNGRVQDVYEWEPQGVGDCAKASGCVALISGGSGENDSLFVDSSASGDDAFFITRQRLLSRDQNSQLDLYDARVGGGLAEQESASCAGEACKGSVSEAPAQPSAGSQSLLGPGNPKPAKPKAHHKKKKKKHKSKPRKTHKRTAKNGKRGGK